MYKTKSFTDVIKSMRRQLATSDKQAQKVLLHIYHNQTEFEQTSKATMNKNGYGFRQGDARALTEMAERLIRNGKLDREDMKILHHRIPAYAWQFVREMRENGNLVKTRDGFTFNGR